MRYNGDMRPGDLFRWTYENGGGEVNTRLWSATMARWIPIGGTCLVIYRDKNRIDWLGPAGHLHCYPGDRDSDDGRGKGWRRVTMYPLEMFPCNAET